jgi:hypothetical protein
MSKSPVIVTVPPSLVDRDNRECSIPTASQVVSLSGPDDELLEDTEAALEDDDLLDDELVTDLAVDDDELIELDEEFNELDEDAEVTEDGSEVNELDVSEPADDDEDCEPADSNVTSELCEVKRQTIFPSGKSALNL